MSNKKSLTKRITFDALLTTAALIIFVVEAQIPPVAPIPGVKLGLANIITVYAMFRAGAKDTFAIMICRVLLGGIYSGQITAFIFSLTGALFCYFAMLLFRRILNEKQIWVCSVIGAIFHNIGQIAAATVILHTIAAAVYLPILIISAIVTGSITGFCAQTVIKRLDRKNTTENEK